MQNIRVKIITLYCGESEFNECVRMVGSQFCCFYFEHVFIKNKSKPDAHNELFGIIMDQADEFDYFVKLDADMIFKDEKSLQRLIAMTIASGADVFSIPVHDYMTNSMIWGLNVYKSGAKWVLGTEELFTDQQHFDGDYVTDKKNISQRESLVSHAESPSQFQAFSFGVHRAAKVVQEGSERFLLGHAWGQIGVLFKVIKAYTKGKDEKRAFAIIGAYYTLKKINASSGFDKKELFFNEFSSINFEADLEKALTFFNGGRLVVLIRVVGFTCFVGGVLDYIKRKVKAALVSVGKIVV